MRSLVRIAFIAALLGAVLIFRQPCSEGMANFVESFGTGRVPDAGLTPNQPSGVYLDPNLTPDQLRQCVEAVGENRTPPAWCSRPASQPGSQNDAANFPPADAAPQ